MQKNKKNQVGYILYNHIINNKREYFIITILFFIGIIIGVFYINNIEQNRISEIRNYVKEIFNNIQSYKNIDLFSLLKKSLVSNILLALLLWFGASTIIGIPIVYGIIVIKGFSIGYTISSILITVGIGKGIIISLIALFLHNIIFIPTIFAISISGIKLYKSIMKNKDRNNIKIEILRHTIFCVVMCILIIVASLIECYISTNLLIFLLNHIKI